MTQDELARIIFCAVNGCDPVGQADHIDAAFEGRKYCDGAWISADNCRIAARAALAQSSTPPTSKGVEAADDQMMIPRQPTEAMMDAGLYNSSHDTTYADVDAIWKGMFDAVALDGGISTHLPASPASKGVEALEGYALLYLPPCGEWYVHSHKLYGTPHHARAAAAKFLHPETPTAVVPIPVQPTPSNDTLQGRGEVEALVEAARPFVAHWERWMDDREYYKDSDEMSCFARVTFGQVRALRAALQKDTGHDG